jgi:hypothetical protein
VTGLRVSPELIALTVALLTFGATARITRFLNADEFARPIREWVERRFGTDSWLDYLIGCPWCLSIWVAAVVVPLGYWFGTTPWFFLPASALTVSYGYALLAQTADED